MIIRILNFHDFMIIIMIEERHSAKGKSFSDRTDTYLQKARGAMPPNEKFSRALPPNRITNLEI